MAALGPEQSLNRSVTGFVDDWQVTVLDQRRRVVGLAVEVGKNMIRLITGMGLQVNTSKTTVVCDHRPTALAIAGGLGAPTKARGMYVAKNLGMDHAPGRQRRWRQGGSQLTQRLLRGVARLARAAKLKAGGSARQRTARLFATNVRPAVEYGVSLHGLSPTENVKLETLAARALAPFCRGVSRTAKLLYHGEPAADAQTASTYAMSAECWKARDGVPGALPLGGVCGGGAPPRLASCLRLQGWMAGGDRPLPRSCA